MDAATDAKADAGSAAPPRGNGGAAGHVAGVVETVTLLADLQVRLWLAELRQVALRVLLAVLFAILAALLAIAMALFLYAGIFHILTDMLHIPTAWALLVFAAVHGLAAGSLFVLALGMLRRDAGTASGGKS